MYTILKRTDYLILASIIMSYKLAQIDFPLFGSIIVNSSAVKVFNIATQNPNLIKSDRVESLSKQI